MDLEVCGQECKPIGPAPGQPSDSVAAWFEYCAPDFTQSNVATIAGVKKLVEAKKALRKSKGSFLRLLEELGQDPDKVERLFVIARHPVLGDSAHARNFPLSWMTQFTLAKIPADTLLDLIANGTVNSGLTRREAERLVQQVRGLNGGNDGDADTVGDESVGEPAGEAEEGHREGHGNGADGVADGQGETGDAPAVQNTVRDDVGANSQSEIERKLARLDELEREKRQWEIQRAGYESEVEELRAKLGPETNLHHPRKLFRQALKALQESETPKLLRKDRQSRINSALTDLVELVRSLTRDGLKIERLDLYCRPEAH
jgi:hypothetical protein